MAALTTVAETRTLAWLLGDDDPAPVAPVLPLMVRLMTEAGSDSAPGTEVTGGTYEPVPLTTTTPEDGEADNAATLRWEGIPDDLGDPDTVIVAVEVWDSAGAPVRWWHGDLTEPKIVTDGVLEIPAGGLHLTMD